LKIVEKGSNKMLAVNTHPHPEEIDLLQSFLTWPVVIEVQPDTKLEKLLPMLSPETPWGDRRIAAIELGHLRSRVALPALLAALPEDPFWMVRCAMIQALERIGDPGAIPTLQEVANSDGFQVVRAYAAKAIERLS
jgi:HEAT repeat protein